MRRDDVGRLAELHGGLVFAFGSDNLGTTFALGFGLTEGLLARADELYGVEVLPDPAGVRIEMDVSSACFARLKDKRRSMRGRTGCGLCGTESLEQVEPPLAALVPCTTPLSPPAIAAALRAMPSHQALQQRTGATHAAAWCALDGQVRLVREDVGRHNAMDNVIGWALREGLVPLHPHVLCVSGRLSFELVQKAAMAGAPILVGVGAPSSLAVRLADDRGMTLAGFARGGRVNVYTGTERVVPAPA